MALKETTLFVINHIRIWAFSYELAEQHYQTLKKLGLCQ